jgi:23S rRNA A1618 N6-methylase RlmF
MDDGKLNFKKRKVCFVVCQVLLAEYFSVGYWKIPKKYLIPAIPQRMNYLCWIKEIMNIDNLTVLDM